MLIASLVAVNLIELKLQAKYSYAALNVYG